jgi:hypothetical protein
LPRLRHGRPRLPVSMRASRTSPQKKRFSAKVSQAVLGSEDAAVNFVSEGGWRGAEESGHFR